MQEEQVELSIEELSARVGVTARNIRAYQTQGLLPLPERRGRTSVYGAEHVTRLEMIRDMREQGIGLPAIERLTEWGREMAPGELRAIAGTLLQGLVDETPYVVDESDAYEIWGDEITPALLERAQRTGFFDPRDDGTVLVRSPTLRQQGIQLRAMGGTFEDAVAMSEVLRTHLDAIAESFTDLFVERLTERALEAGSPPRDQAEALKVIAAAVEQTKPMATSAVNAAFRLILQERVERTFDAGIAERFGGRGD